MDKIVSYDQMNDILFIHNGFKEGEKFKTNMETRNLVFDVSTNGRVLGVEIFNASKFFRSFGMNGTTLQNLDSAQFQASMASEGITASIILKTKGSKQPVLAKIALPQKTLSLAES